MQLQLTNWFRFSYCL